MIEDFLSAAAARGIEPHLIAYAGIALGALVFVFGMSRAFATSPVGRRMALPRHGAARADFDLVRGGSDNPSGLLRAFVPSSKEERTRIERKLRQAGRHGPNAVRNFFVLRSLLAVLLPLLLLAFYGAPVDLLRELRLDGLRARLDQRYLIQGLVLCVAFGFFGPSAWLERRIESRREKIRLALPNALDLLQVAVEAGLGFDAALVRVSHELAAVAPEISEELMMLELEIQAGRDRDRAFADMADRIGIEEVHSFVNVVLQSAQFGSSISQALATYSSEMRMMRELKAQEKANKLPVKMSGVLALCMMPTLLMICLAPVAIRWIRMNEGG